MANPLHALTKRVAELEKIVSNLLADAPRKQHEKSVPDQQQAQDEQEKVEARSSVLSQRNPSAVQANDPNAKWYNSVEWWKAKPFKWWKDRFEIVALAAGVGYAVVTYFQWHDLRRNFQVDERSWIKMAYSWPSLTPNQDVVAINSNLVNFGKSPVTWLVIDGTFQIVNAEDSPSFSLKSSHSTTTGIFLTPGDSADFQIRLFDQKTKQPRGFTAQELEDLSEGKSYIATFGWLIYVDQFGRHWYRFCNWQGYHNGAFYSEECVRENLMGDGKPKVPVN